MGGAPVSAPREGRLSRWLGAAALLHVVGFAGAGRLDGERPRVMPPEAALLTVESATEQSAAVGKAPEPPPPAPPRVEEAPRPSKAPRMSMPGPKPISHQPAAVAPDVRPPVEERFVRALSAVAAEASKLLTNELGKGPPMASGEALSASGLVAGNGTGASATFDARAGLRGRPGGSGPPPPPDRSRGAGVSMGYTDDCDFPVEADRAHIDHGWAMLVVTVRPDGRAAEVRVLEDSGSGFGPAARRCALRARYQPALDRTGTPTQTDTPPFRYRFTR